MANTDSSADDRARDYEVQYFFTEFVTQHLLDCSRVFKGDLQEMLVLAVIGQVHLQRFMATSGANDDYLLKTITSSRIADITGIPRETVRRKLLAMKERGWLERDSDGAWRLTMQDSRAVAEEALGGLYGRGMERALKFAGAVKRHV